MPDQALTTQPPAPPPAKSPGPLAQLSSLLDHHKDQIRAALPLHMTAERMIRIALTAYSRTPGLINCTASSVAGAIVEASIMGLEPNSQLGHAYLVPFWNKKANGGKGANEAQLIPGYKGLLKLARNSGEVSMIDAQVVYSNDTFDFQKGSDTWWIHKWARTGPRGEPDGVWAGYVLKDGSKNFEYWTISQIEEHRDKYSKSAYDKQGNLTGAWLDSPEWMWKKTVLRQVVKLMPQSVDLARALQHEEHAEVGIPQTFDIIPSETLELTDGEGRPEPPEEPQRKSAGKGKGTASTAPASGASAPDVKLDPDPPAETAKTTTEAPPDADPKKIKPRPVTLTSIKELKAEIGDKTWWAVMGESSFEKVEDIPTEAIARVVLGVMRGHVK